MIAVEDIKNLIMGSPAIRASVLDAPFRIPARTKHIFCQGALPSMQRARGTDKENDAP